MGVDVVVCAHNEAERIAPVLDAIRGAPTTAKIIVVCDSCEDNTAQVSSPLADHVVEIDAHNKGTAMAVGLERVETPHVVFCDADITGLRPGHMAALSTWEPMDGQVVALRGETPSGQRSTWIWIARQVPAVSGERRLPTAFARTVPLAGSGWEAETRINAAVAKAGMPWQHIVLHGVRNRNKIRRDFRGWATEFGRVMTVTATYGPELLTYAAHPQGRARPAAAS